ncbi:hypothetical protein [Massilia rubra]|uniref:Uncharacterized protein n=1 Tax=Massilia rubra TaxID=2607910 RepID=A0ABX0M861_9BURK|nr:hypothetical protein [Massilia rubra]NHZ38376.1 hypothetical protein [Massilia rubra]
MMMDCDNTPVAPPQYVVTVDMYTQLRTVDRFDSLPDHRRYSGKTVKCNGKRTRVLTPVAKIIEEPRDSDGKLVAAEHAYTIEIISLDAKDNILQRLTIRRQSGVDDGSTPER